MKKEYHKMLTVGTEVWVSNRKNISSFPICDFGNLKEWRASIRHSNGVLEWQWCDKFEDAVAWCERSKGVDLAGYIRNVLDHLAKPGLATHEAYRAYGALECALIVAGVLVPGKPFEYQEKGEIKRTFFFVWKGRRKERYGELMKRLANEYLAKQDAEFNPPEVGEYFNFPKDGK